MAQDDPPFPYGSVNTIDDQLQVVPDGLYPTTHHFHPFTIGCVGEHVHLFAYDKRPCSIEVQQSLVSTADQEVVILIKQMQKAAEHF